MSEIRTRVRTSYHLGDKTRQALQQAVGSRVVPSQEITWLSPHPSTCSPEAQPQQGSRAPAGILTPGSGAPGTGPLQGST